MSSSSILRQVGLMYISDYLYAEDSGNNWLRVNADTWFITQNAVILLMVNILLIIITI